MNKEAFIKGYLGKEAFGGALVKGVGAFALPIAPAMTIDIAGEKLQDRNIAEYRRKLGLPPEEPDPEDISQKKLQEQATAGSVPITT